MGKSFYQQRLEKSKKKAQEESVEVLLGKLEPAMPEAEPKVEIYSEAEMKEIVADTKSHTALNVFYDSQKKQFMLVTLTYSPTTGQASVKSIEPFSDNIVVASRKIAEMLSMKLFRKEEEI